ncbi:MAG: chemotaxis protein CheB [Burkholderiaceae bacterium]
MPDRTPQPAQTGSNGAHGSLNFPVVGIGASAGGVAALKGFFSSLPPNPDMAFVVIVHLSPGHESNLAQILRTVVGMPVLQVQTRTEIEPNHVYVISPALELQVQDNYLAVAPLTRIRGANLAIDMFLRTLADTNGTRAIGIVLSGTGSDGSVGLRSLKEKGGVAIAQLPAEAEFAGMPSSAIATGVVDFVLPVAEMGSQLVDLWRNTRHIELPEPEAGKLQVMPPPSQSAAEDAERALRDVMALLRQRTGHDFHHYKRSTVLRRIERRLQVTTMPNLPAYRVFLERNPQEAQALLRDLLISVTSFFRDPEGFAALDRELQTWLSARKSPQRQLRAWVAGCASGEEAYSIAMLLMERASELRSQCDVQVFATDIDERAIAMARAGRYPSTIALDVPQERLARFFLTEGMFLRVRKELRDAVLFAAHNILRDPPFSQLDLVCCRNLLIYLDREVQDKLLRLFHFALRPGGLLFLGSSESADIAEGLFTPVDSKLKIYRAVVTGERRVAPELPWNVRLKMPDAALEAGTVQTDASKLLGSLLVVHAPAMLLTDGAYAILQSTPPAEAFLRFVPGASSRNLLEVVRPELSGALHAVLLKASAERKSVEGRKVRLKVANQDGWATVSARPVQHEGASYLLVAFSHVQATLARVARSNSGKDPMLELLEEELKRTRAQLDGSLGEAASSNEELRASNEELQAINEEMRSATEELETGKEELQSVNEELITVNQELKNNVEEVGNVNDDLKNLISSTDIATVFVDPGMRIRRFTPRASRLFNLIETDVGRSLLDITHRLDYPELEADAKEAFRSLRVVEREVLGQQGTTYLVRALPYRTHHDVIDGAVLTFVDITRIRRAEERVREGEANLRLMVESMRDFAILATDPQGLITSWNEGAKRMFGYEEREMLGQPIELLCRPESLIAGVAQAERRRALEEGQATDEGWHLRKDGTEFYCSGIMAPMFEGDKLVGFSKIARDRTEQKRAATQLEELLVQEKQTRAQLQRAMQMKDEFLAVMSHELKNPLNLIHVNAELLARLPEARSSAAVARAADVIRRAVNSQLKITNDLLDLSRAQTGKLVLNLTPVLWAQAVGRVVDAIADDIQSQGLRLECDLGPPALLVQADPIRLDQVVWNLLSNALKFTPRGGTISVRLSVDGDMGRMDVSDTGRGLDPDFIDHIFEMFRQADRSTTRSQGGMGIGLALVKQLVDGHGGRVAVFSDGHDKGTRLSVWLPLSDGGSTAAAPQATEQQPLSRLRVLVVDDTLDSLESFAMLLELEGAAVTAVDSAGKALEALAANSFDLLVSDVAMPEVDGYGLIAAVRANPLWASMPAVALTGFARADDVKRALDAGFDAHLGKPVELEELRNVIQDVVGGSR